MPTTRVLLRVRANRLRTATSERPMTRLERRCPRSNCRSGRSDCPVAFPDYEDEAGEDEWDSPQIEGVSKTWKAVNVTDVVIREVGNVPCRVDGLTERQQIPGQNMVRPLLLNPNDQPGDRRAADQKVQHKPRFPFGDSEDRRRQNRGQ